VRLVAVSHAESRLRAYGSADLPQILHRQPWPHQGPGPPLFASSLTCGTTIVGPSSSPQDAQVRRKALTGRFLCFLRANSDRPGCIIRHGASLRLENRDEDQSCHIPKNHHVNFQTVFGPALSRPGSPTRALPRPPGRTADEARTSDPKTRGAGPNPSGAPLPHHSQRYKTDSHGHHRRGLNSLS
jgi:hypothetical protein